MDTSFFGSGLKISELLFKLRMGYGGRCDDLYRAIRTSSSTYLKVERGERELSFLMALRICEFYQLDLHEFISMLSDEELGRQDYSVIKAKLIKERSKARKATKFIDISTKTAHHN